MHVDGIRIVVYKYTKDKNQDCAHYLDGEQKTKTAIPKNTWLNITWTMSLLLIVYNITMYATARSFIRFELIYRMVTLYNAKSPITNWTIMFPETIIEYNIIVLMLII